MHEGDDLVLLRRIIAKDRQAFETLYQRYARRLYGYLAKFISQPEVIEEVLDDVMFVVWQQATRFDHTSRLSTWIFGIAYHKALKARARVEQLPPELPAAPREERAQARRDRYAARQAYERAALAADRLQRRDRDGWAAELDAINSRCRSTVGKGCFTAAGQVLTSPVARV